MNENNENYQDAEIIPWAANGDTPDDYTDIDLSWEG